MKHTKYIGRAIELAQNSAGTKRAKHSALLVSGKEVMAVGYNSYTTHPQMYKLNILKPYLHAEADALMKVRHKNTDGATLYVAKVSLANNVGLSRPCESCISIIRLFNIRRIIYTTPDGFAIENIS